MVTSASKPVNDTSDGVAYDVSNEAQRLIFREAELLDQGNYQDWLTLFSDDATYWIPSWKAEFQLVEDVTRELSYIYLTHDMLCDYVVRMSSASAFAIGPGLRTTRIIGNLKCATEDALCVSSSWMMHIYRRHQPELFSGRCEHKLVMRDGRLQIAAKTVVLINDQFEFGHMPLV